MGSFVWFLACFHMLGSPMHLASQEYLDPCSATRPGYGVGAPNCTCAGTLALSSDMYVPYDCLLVTHDQGQLAPDTVAIHHGTRYNSTKTNACRYAQSAPCLSANMVYCGILAAKAFR